jgi:hypothetical protein
LRAVESALARAHESGNWHLPAETIVALEALLALYDEQIASVPLHEVLDAEQKRFCRGKDRGTNEIDM